MQLVTRSIARICKFIATLGPIGYLPFAPGTWGTLCAIFLLKWYRVGLMQLGVFTEALTTPLLVVLAYYIIKHALPACDPLEDDPQEIVLDEVAGFFVAMFSLSFAPIPLLLGFGFFRLFDIVKPFGIDALQTLPGALGILADDIAAGALAYLATTMVLYALVR